MKITLVAGARPNFVKVAPVVRALNLEETRLLGVDFELVHTGQHYDDKLSRVFFEQLGIPEPSVNLQVGSGSHAEQTARIMVEFEKHLSKNATGLVVVFGDVNSTMACAIVAKKMNIPLAHVEAGIRSFDLSMPEEINRIVTDALADWFFTTSEIANQNLLDKGVPKERIFFVGNTMIDSLLYSLPFAKKPSVWDSASLRERSYIVLTMHRPSNVDDVQILNSWLRVVDSLELPVIFPVHPRIRTVIESLKSDLRNFFLCEPLSYLEFIFLLKSAYAVITDSGGVQEETTVLRIPCITLRPNTERPETVIMGTNRLVGTNHDRLRQSIKEIPEARQSSIPPLWDGHASERIIDVLIRISKNGRPN